jgi:hypothetical protein
VVTNILRIILLKWTISLHREGARFYKKILPPTEIKNHSPSTLRSLKYIKVIVSSHYALKNFVRHLVIKSKHTWIYWRHEFWIITSICLTATTCLYVNPAAPTWHGIATSRLSATACGWPWPSLSVPSVSVWHSPTTAMTGSRASLCQPYSSTFTRVSVSKVRPLNTVCRLPTFCIFLLL